MERHRAATPDFDSTSSSSSSRRRAAAERDRGHDLASADATGTPNLVTTPRPCLCSEPRRARLLPPRRRAQHREQRPNLLTTPAGFAQSASRSCNAEPRPNPGDRGRDLAPTRPRPRHGHRVKLLSAPSPQPRRPSPCGRGAYLVEPSRRRPSRRAATNRERVATPTSPKPLAACSPRSPPWQQHGSRGVAVVSANTPPLSQNVQQQQRLARVVPLSPVSNQGLKLFFSA